MTIDPALAAFIDSPNTIDFITLQSEVLSGFLRNNPDYVLTQALLAR